ncbi:short-chain dehydrogenase [Pseudomonas prosekii]|uniref:Short-chain dehydrogenase n=1 Tax=Pseudomonas prosekii TaxID=1148509 RepID=A0A2U2D8I0_9PSED|nr:short-chain dehydrogenase [Pseudomonas prosekii]PWE44875.1 short-chain dehydrogenase [Pseudomonas prosekii]
MACRVWRHVKESVVANTAQPPRSLLSTASYRIRAVTQILENLAMRGDLTSYSVILTDFALLLRVPLRNGCDLLEVIARRLDAA